MTQNKIDEGLRPQENSEFLPGGRESSNAFWWSAHSVLGALHTFSYLITAVSYDVGVAVFYR